MTRFMIPLLLALVVSPPVSAGIFGPDSYEECILKNMKGVGNDIAAQAVKSACRKQFPEFEFTLGGPSFGAKGSTPIPTKYLNDFKFVIVHWKYVVSSGNPFELKIRIYNESQNWVLTEYTTTTLGVDEKPQFAREHKVTFANVLPNKIGGSTRWLKEHICADRCIIKFKNLKGVTLDEYRRQERIWLKTHPKK
jgi:hypothetical protein